jgi:hypothetical protein
MVTAASHIPSLTGLPAERIPPTGLTNGPDKVWEVVPGLVEVRWRSPV